MVRRSLRSLQRRVMRLSSSGSATPIWRLSGTVPNEENHSVPDTTVIRRRINSRLDIGLVRTGDLMEYNKEDLIEQLIDHEGLKLKPYECTAGKLTIGVGRNLEDRGISDDEAEYLLHNDIEIVERELLEAQPLVSMLDAVRQRVLVDMGFNLGTPTLMKFQKMWDAVEDEDWEEASAQMLDSRWAKQVGRRAVRLADAMKTGEWV
jgi:Phage-related lysozyme (muraminidase)